MSQEIVLKHKELSELVSKVRLGEDLIDEGVVAFNQFIEDVEDDASYLVEWVCIVFLLWSCLFVVFVKDHLFNRFFGVSVINLVIS